MNITFFIVVVPNMEYNDENYHREGYDETEKIFATRELAQMHCDQVNVDQIKTIGLNSYGYELSDLTKLTAKEASKRVKKLGIEFDPTGEELETNLDKLTVKNVGEFLAVFSEIEIAQVKELPLEGSAHEVAERQAGKAKTA